MDKNAIKKYAVWARRELIERVSQRALVYGITAKDAGDPNAESVNGHLLSQAEKRQRQALIRNIKEKGYEQVMEEVAYTWFNRFAALRFMEVNGYLPSHIRVFTNDAGEFKPQILAEAIHLELDGLDMNKVYELESANKSEELFKYLLIVQCNALNSILPGMFQRIEDYTELLLPDYLLREGSVIEQMVTTIPENDWTDQVQIIGWLYQYYNTEPKDKVFADQKRGIKVSKEDIPAATQLFTPDWIVHYMVENSLGRLWLEGHPNDTLKSEWKYYLDEAEQEPEVQAQLVTIRKEYAALKPEDIRVIDPCMGSGHILCVLFDVLVRIYEDYGYTAREAAVKIVENNLWGLDIDERAAQLSYFAVMMKARQYDRRFFTRKVQPHVYAIEESNGITSAPMHDMGLNLSQEEYGEAVKQAMRLVEEMHDAKEYGSLVTISQADWDLLRRFAVPREEDGQLHLDVHGEIEASARLQRLVNVGQALAQRYHSVVTNPPYMGNNGMSAKLSDFVKQYYPDSKADLFAAFIEKCSAMVSQQGFAAMITQHAWMFLASYESLRNKIQNERIINLAHFGPRAFDEISGEVVQTVSFILNKIHVRNYNGVYVGLTSHSSESGKQQGFLSGNGRFVRKQEDFAAIQGTPYTSYWASQDIFNAFKHNKLVGDISEPRVGMATANNDRFVRLWHEVDRTRFSDNSPSRDAAKASKKKWFPFAKGGEQRKWYGNNDTVVNWENDGFEIQNFKDEKTGRIRSHNYNLEYIFSSALTWTVIGTDKTSFRYCPTGFLYSNSGYGMFCDQEVTKMFLLGFMNSKVAASILQILSPSMGFESGYLRKLPLVFERVTEVASIVKECVTISKDEWDSFESSWDFQVHPFIASAREMSRKGVAVTIKQFFGDWQGIAERRFRQLKVNEEKLNRIFIEIYGLCDELTPEVEDREITARRADLQRDARSFISYAVGCMFGRYSLDVPGLVYAGGEWDASKYTTFQPDKDAIIPICDDEYFADDIVGRFVKFVEVVYGKETLEGNLCFIADALGGKGSSREVIRSYFINDFYADHLKVYQKRPIYWLFDSGKKNGFKCLVYMHRYQPDTIARIRTDYVHEQQSRYRTAIADLEQRINGASTSERVKLSKQLAKLQAQAEEVRVYEEKIHHLADQMIKIDLDDGVKHNYEIFKDVLAKIK